jgi:hypothetical protein
MNDFFNTIGGRRLSEHTLPDMIRKMDALSKVDVDGLIKALNRMAKAQEEANRLAKGNRLQERENTPEGRDAKMEPWKLDILREVMIQLKKADASGIVLKDADAQKFLSSTHLVDDFPIAYSIEGDWIRVWKVGISDNDAARWVDGIEKFLRESEKDTVPLPEASARVVREEERVSRLLRAKGFVIGDDAVTISVTKPVPTMSDEAIFNFVGSIVAEIGDGEGITVRGKSYRSIRDNDQLRAVLMGRGVKIEIDEEDDSADLTMGEKE